MARVAQLINRSLLTYFVAQEGRKKQPPEPEYYENYNLEDIITPINVRKLVQLLTEAGYSETEIQFLNEGFTNGFDINYKGPTNRQSESDNIPLKI